MFVCAGAAIRQQLQAVLKRAQQSGNLIRYSYALDQFYIQLAGFLYFGPWDAQRVGGNYFVRDYRDYATIAIGLYMASAGVPREECSRIQNLAALASRFDEPMDPIYTRIPIRNVENTNIGYDLAISGRISCPDHD